MDLASELVSQGVAVDVRVGVPETPIEAGVAATVVALKSRVAPPDQAVRETLQSASWFSASAPKQIFYKYSGSFDSTEKGNIGCCVDALQALTQADRVLFCPTHPLNERTVYNGYLFFGQRLVSDSSKRYDPLTPMTEPDLTKVLAAQTRVAVGLLPWRTLSKGLASMQEATDRLVAAGRPYIIADAIRDEDLDRLAELTVDWPLVTGNAMIGAHLAKLWRQRGQLDAFPLPGSLQKVQGAGAVLAGSCADQTRAQLQVFENHGGQVLHLDLHAVMAGEDVVGRSLEWARARLGDVQIAIATSSPPEDVFAIQAKLGRDTVAELAENTLAEIGRGLVESGLGRLVVAGGETSGAIIAALGIKKLSVGPQIPGKIPLAYADVGRPLGLCLKSGKLGDDDAFMERLQALETGQP
ncbi:four-carbon acid sugar kinase family protein [Acidisoma cellulosilytica]|uniref:3-oxo-tetronate kinase n=1 Tax=Acidisoma cellulosilyticum TaxID=2802395 RepID=A0A964E693_9PROT|nr:four-carbon acid sugar kinase family protein [Acidisoma cellulosilyticum]